MAVTEPETQERVAAEQQPPRASASAVALLVGAMVSLALGAIGMAGSIAPGREFLFWWAACFAAAALWIRLPLDRVTLSMAACLEFCVVLVLPLGEAMVCAALASLPAELLFMRKSPVRALYNAAHTVLAVGAASLALGAAGAVPGEVVSSPGMPLIPLLLAAAAYYLVNRGAVSLAVAVSRGIGFRAAWRENFGHPVDRVVSAAVLSLGAILAVLEAHAGVAGAALVVFPLMAACDAYRRFVERRAAGAAPAAGRREARTRAAERVLPRRFTDTGT